jgi:uncharacterized membrane protein YkoI
MTPFLRAALAASALFALSLSPSFAVAIPEDGTSAEQHQATAQDTAPVERALAAFRASTIRLPEALGIAKQLSEGALVADISFDNENGKRRYRIRTLVGDRLEERLIDATTGKPDGDRQDYAINDLGKTDRDNLAALRSVGPTMSDAVRVAEHSAAGQAISGGLTKQDGRLNYVIVVLSGDDLKQVVLEPPPARAARK